LTKTLYILTIFVLTSIFSFAQADWKSELKLIEYDSILHNRIYEIGVEEYQMVQLVEFQSGEFEGTLTNSVWTTNRKKDIIKRIIQTIKIPESIVTLLMKELKLNDFENIPDSDNYMQLDGRTTFFTVKTDKVDRTYSYWELESDYYYRERPIPIGVRKSRKILDLINARFDLKKQYENFISRLPFEKNTYSSIILDIDTNKETRAFTLAPDIVKSRIKRITRQLSKNGFNDVHILTIEEVDHILTMAEKNDDSHKEVSTAFRGVISENVFRNLKITETIYLQVKFVEKAKPRKLRIVKLNSSFKFKGIIQ